MLLTSFIGRPTFCFLKGSEKVDQIRGADARWASVDWYSRHVVSRPVIIEDWRLSWRLIRRVPLLPLARFQEKDRRLADPLLHRTQLQLHQLQVSRIWILKSSYLLVWSLRILSSCTFRERYVYQASLELYFAQGFMRLALFKLFIRLTECRPGV